jgi:hypothetical protein
LKLSGGAPQYRPIAKEDWDMSINRTLATYSEADLRMFVWCLLDVLYREGNRINLHKKWDSDTFEEINKLLGAWGLHPATALKKPFFQQP